MAIVNQVQKKVRMDQWDIIRFQLLMHCYLKRIKISELDLNCLTLLSLSGEVSLTEFCERALSNEVFGSIQSVRNALTKAEKKNLIIKTDKYKKKITINPVLNIQTSGNILLDLKILRVEPVKSEAVIA